MSETLLFSIFTGPAGAGRGPSCAGEVSPAGIGAAAALATAVVGIGGGAATPVAEAVLAAPGVAVLAATGVVSHEQPGRRGTGEETCGAGFV